MKVLKITALTLLGFALWVTLFYLAIAFVQLELNSLKWSEITRFTIVGFSFVYIIFLPIVILYIKDLIK